MAEKTALLRPKKITYRNGRPWAMEPPERINQSFYCMPLLKNVPNGNKDWELTKCPLCGRNCWRTPYAGTAESMGAMPACTECALKKGAVN